MQGAANSAGMILAKFQALGLPSVLSGVQVLSEQQVEKLWLLSFASVDAMCPRGEKESSLELIEEL